MSCQRRGYIDCKARVRGGCEIACQEPEGALFCDGQYVDHGGNLDACADAIRQALAIEVDLEASGSASSTCSGNSCEGSAEGSASASCDIGGAPGSSEIPGGVLAALAASITGARLSRRRKLRASSSRAPTNQQ